MRIPTLTFALYLSFAGLAHATPPQTVEVRETLLGLNNTHMFVLRTLDDNMGLYTMRQTDVVLIARNRATNQDDQIWPVLRAKDMGPEVVETDGVSRLEVLPLPDRINPFDILLWRKARPLLGDRIRTADDLGIDQIWDASGLSVTVDNGGTTHGLQNDDIANLFKTSLNRTRKVLPPYFTEGGDMLADVEFSPETDCTSDGYTSLFEAGGENQKETWIARISCENDITMSKTEMFLVIPPTD